MKSFNELLILLKIWLFLICENQNVNIKKRINRKIFSRFFACFFPSLNRLYHGFKLHDPCTKKGLRKVSKAFFVWLVSFRQKLQKSAPRASYLKGGVRPVTGIFDFTLWTIIFSLTKLIVRRITTTRISLYYYHAIHTWKQNFQLIEKFRELSMPHLYLSLLSSSPIKCT